MTSNFGGKKAAPFRKGGKPRKAIVAKAVVAKAKRAKREMALSVITGREIDLGRDGSKWKHGWIPLNASAAALKMHKRSGGKGDFSDLPEADQKRLTGFTDMIRSHVSQGSASPLRVGKHTIHQGSAASSTRFPEGHFSIHSTEQGHTSYPRTETGYRSAAIQMHTENPHVARGAKKATHTIGRDGSVSDASGNHLGSVVKETASETGNSTPSYRAKKGTSETKSFGTQAEAVAWLKGSRFQPKPNVTSINRRDRESQARMTGGAGDQFRTPAAEDMFRARATTAQKRLAVQNHSQMSDQDKIDAVEKMHGTGSKQHLAALQRFGTESQKRAAAYQIREGNPATRTTGTGGKKATELHTTAELHAIVNAGPPSARGMKSADYRAAVAWYNKAKAELQKREIPGRRSGGTAGGGYNEKGV